MFKYHLLKQHTELVEQKHRKNRKRNTAEHVFTAKVLVGKLCNPSADAWHVENLRCHKSINADARAGKGFGSQQATHYRGTNQPSAQLKIWCGNEKSHAFETDTGVPQGDCVWANLFTLYLAKALDSNKHDHDYCSTIIKPPAHITNNHQYAYINNKINLKIADNMGHVLSDMRNIEYAKKTLPLKLSSCDLIMNEEKTRIHY